MKKNLIALFAATTMILSSAAAFAEATPAPADGSEVNEPVLISTEVPAEENTVADGEENAPVVMPSYIVNTVTVTNVDGNTIETKTEGLEAENEMDNVINFNTDDETVVLSRSGNKKALKDIKKDSKVTVYTFAYEPAPLILPPLYKANVIIVEDKSENLVDVDTYLAGEEDMVVNAAFTLALNIDKNTKVVDKNNKTLKNEELANKDLIVFYDTMTKSIPAQTTPSKVVVLGENEVALKNIEAAKSAEATPAPEATADPAATEVPMATLTPAETAEPVDFTKMTSVKVEDKVIDNVYVKDNTLMLPIRAIAEAMGMSVSWDGELKAVMLNDGMYSLKIGENSYVAGKMTPVELECAPEITNDLTYVPFDYFTEIMQKSLNVDLDNNTMEITDAPAATEVPAVTEAPEATADPAATEAPEATADPAATEAPTEKPAK